MKNTINSLPINIKRPLTSVLFCKPVAAPADVNKRTTTPDNGASPESCIPSCKKQKLKLKHYK